MKKYFHSKWTSVEKLNGWRHFEVKNVFVKVKNWKYFQFVKKIF